jgi:hypothetical protein
MLSAEHAATRQDGAFVTQSATRQHLCTDTDTAQLAKARAIVPHLEARLALEAAPVVVDVAVVVQDVDELQAVALAHQEVIGVVRGSDLHST